MMVQEHDHHFRLRIRVLDIVLVIKWVANGKYIDPKNLIVTIADAQG